MTKLREAVLRRIRALLAKTTENGATEAEAMFATAKARDLMDRYQVQEGELGLKEERIKGRSRARRTVGQLDVTIRLVASIAKFCDCETWTEGSSGNVRFYGLESDMEFAHYLLDSLEVYIVKGAEQHVGERYLRGRDRLTAEKSFTVGAVFRINDRLAELVRQRQGVKLSDGKSLVVLKQTLIAGQMKADGIKLRKRSISTSRKVDPDAYRAGKEAGDKARFDRPLGSTTRGAIEG